MEYRIVAVNHSTEFGRQATVLEEHLRDGWKLHGGPVLMGDYQLVQAVTRAPQSEQAAASDKPGKTGIHESSTLNVDPRRKK